MSLKAFHIVFILLSTLLAVGFGLSSYHDQAGDVPAELDQEVQDLAAAIIAGEVSAS